MSEKRYRIKRLQWEVPSCGRSQLICAARTPIGQGFDIYLVRAPKPFHWSWNGFSSDIHYENAATLNEAKAAAQAYWEKRLAEALEE